MADDLYLSHFDKFEVELGSSLRHRRNASHKIKHLIKKNVEIKLDNQNFTCTENNIDLRVKHILDDVQNIRNKLNIIETTNNYFDNTVFDIEETVQELESIVNIVAKNKNTIFSHRILL